MSEGFLNFLPWAEVKIFASYQDLLLVGVGRVHSKESFVICNPFTRKWIELPTHPSSRKLRFCHGGLVLCDHDQIEVDQIRFKVMMIWVVSLDASDNNRILRYGVSIFSSEAGNWSQST